jgi:uncharacterized membrane protein YgcG
MPTRTPSTYRVITAALLVGLVPAWAQQPPAAAPASASAAAPAAAVSQQELDQLLAPIALYPDALVAQILMASTYPLEVVEAARWSKANPKVTGKALEDAMQKQTWDPAVKALTAVPQVLGHMNENLAWTQKLGDAFLADQKAVMKTVQTLRAKAQAAGNLKSTPEQTVKTEQQGGQTVYIIESPKTEVVYVPTYNPATVYGTWWYPYPPYSMYPPAYVYPPGLAFATGVVVGAAIWGNCNWGGNEININRTNYNNFNRTNIQNTNFQHNAASRKGVPYGNQAAAQKYNRGGDAKAAQSREQYRGREQASAATQGADRAGGRDAASPGAGGRDAASRSPSAGSMDTGGRPASAASSGSRSGSGGGGFSGAGSGASTQAASNRGSASRSSASASSRGGGGGGGRGGGGRR